MEISHIDYEVLSKDTVRELHQKFMTSIEARAERLMQDIPQHGALLEPMKELLIACAKKQIDLAPDECAERLKGGKAAIENRTEEIKLRVHSRGPQQSQFAAPSLTKKQERAVVRSAKRRKEHPAVTVVFGDEERLYLRLQIKEGDVVSNTHKKIAEHLAKKGYSITDYNKGYATDKDGKQTFKIGKLLKDVEYLYVGFRDDPIRTGSSLLVVISRKPEDIALMSTGRAWSSCMSGKGAFRYPCRDIRAGALIAYLITEKDPDITNPLARITIKPFKERGGFLTAVAAKVFHREPRQIFGLGTNFGLHNEVFSRVTEAFVEEKLNGDIEGIFKMARNLYGYNVLQGVERRDHKTKPRYRY